MRQVGYLQRLYRDAARSTEHKSLLIFFAAEVLPTGCVCVCVYVCVSVSGSVFKRFAPHCPVAGKHYSFQTQPSGILILF